MECNHCNNPMKKYWRRFTQVEGKFEWNMISVGWSCPVCLEKVFTVLDYSPGSIITQDGLTGKKKKAAGNVNNWQKSAPTV